MSYDTGSQLSYDSGAEYDVPLDEPALDEDEGGTQPRGSALWKVLSAEVLQSAQEAALGQVEAVLGVNVSVACAP